MVIKVVWNNIRVEKNTDVIVKIMGFRVAKNSDLTLKLMFREVIQVEETDDTIIIENLIKNI